MGVSTRMATDPFRNLAREVWGSEGPCQGLSGSVAEVSGKQETHMKYRSIGLERERDESRD